MKLNASFDNALASVQVYTAGGRRMLPALKLGSAIRFLAADSGWRLLAVTVAGDVRVLDLRALGSPLDTSLTPLLSGALAGTQGEGLAAVTMLHPGASLSLHLWRSVQDADWGNFRLWAAPAEAWLGSPLICRPLAPEARRMSRYVLQTGAGHGQVWDAPVSGTWGFRALSAHNIITGKTWGRM